MVRVALLGNPNTGKTTLFNRLTGLRHKTSNFPGTTLDARSGKLGAGADGPDLDLLDLPGVYSLELDLLESRVAREALDASGERACGALLVVLDATNLARNLMLAGEALRRRLPMVVALNMTDLAAGAGLRIDAQVLGQRLGCTVVPICARSGEGVDRLVVELRRAVALGAPPTHTAPGGTLQDQARLRAWASELFAASASAEATPERARRLEARTDRADRVLTHPVLGLVCFVGIMALLFASIFWLAQYPMGWIEGVFGALGAGVDWVWARLGASPTGLVHDLLKDGVIAGVGATVVFLPQVCMLFFLISLLEDTGYLARAAFVLDRLLRPFGLPGHAFVPLLSSHACALPGIMAARTIPDPKERLATILVAPFMTCSARLPVYVLLTGLIVGSLHEAGRTSHPALLGAGLFIGCYALGIGAGVLSALLARRTILRGRARPMALELPSYKWPSVRTAVIASYDRGLMFLKKAGTAILAISVILWWLGAFPRVEPSAQALELQRAAQQVRAGQGGVSVPGDDALTLRWAQMPEAQRREAQAQHLEQQAQALDARRAKAGSLLGQIGRAAEPVFAPIGADWQLSIGILASFAAREVFVGTMSIVLAGTEEGEDEEQNQRLSQTLAQATRADGVTRVFNPATCWAMLVFYVLAMQCLPTLVVTAREAGGAKWALLQLGWMSAVAYGAAWVAFRLAGG
jgi:ferrous iron transport protein B